jgi:hypothetical protein
MSYIKKCVLIFLIVFALVFSLIVQASAESDSSVDTEIHYMELILDSIAVRDFKAAEKYNNLRNQKIVLLDLEDTYPTVIWDDAFGLMCVIYQEAGGGEYVTDRELLSQGLCVMNRVNDPRFPNTIKEVLEQGNPPQYETFYRRGVYLLNRGDTELEIKAIKRCFLIALRVLNGERPSNDKGVVCPENMIWASRGKQGTSTWWASKSWTYFCCS